MHEKQCTCGKTKGKYLDNLYAEYTGPCVPLGFNNYSFHAAISNQPSSGLGSRFDAFVIPVICPTMEYIREKKNED